jgi:hypothetical protein
MKIAHRISLALKAASLGALAVLAGLTLSVFVSGGVPGFLSGIAERIPGVSNYVVKDFQTSTFASVSSDTATLKVARYELDFLASFTGKSGRYVAVFPFVVEASIPLDAVRRVPGKKAVEVPAPVLVAHLDTERSRSLVLMDSYSPDYNTMLAPVLEAYRLKSIDCAREDSPFMEAAMKKASASLGALFPGNEIVWKNDAVPPSLVRESESFPAHFSYGTGGEVSFARPASLRDDTIISSAFFGNDTRVPLRFGLSTHSSLSFEAFAKAIRSANEGEHIVFRYHDPVDPRASTFFSFADEGYRAAFSYLSGANNVYYVDAMIPRDVNDEYSIRHVAPNVLYFAASLKPSPAAPAGAANSARYLDNHERALEEVRAGHFGRALGTAVIEMEKSVGKSEPPDADLETFRKLFGIPAGTFGSAKGSAYRGTVTVLEALAASDYGALSAAIRETGEMDVRDDAEATANLQAIFWTMRKEIGIPDADADAYRRDLIAKGATVSQSLVSSLDAADRNALYANFFRTRLPAGDAQSVWTDPDDDTETILFYGKACAEWRKKHEPRELQEKLSSLGLKTGNRFVVLFSDPPDGGFLAPYHALVLDAFSVTVCRDAFALIRFSGSPERVPFSDLRVDGGLFAAGESTFRKEPALAAAFARFRDGFSSPSWNRDELARFIREEIVRDLAASLSRPKPALTPRPSPSS